MRSILLAAFAAFTFSVSAVAAQDGPSRAEEIGGGSRPSGAAWSRSPVFGANGMAATAHPLASQVAIEILKQGGTAVDAAIAANATLGLMEPTGNGIGGDLFAIVWDPKTEKLYGLNASGRSPMGRSYEDLIAALDGADQIPSLGYLPVTVPGAVDGWFELHDKFGKLNMKKVLAPAISYAEDGFPVTPVIARAFRGSLNNFSRREDEIGEFDNARETYFKNGAPETGEIFRNPDLAETLDAIARGGRRVFYRGKIARTIDRYMERIGGDLRYEDLAAHESEWVDVSCVAYRNDVSLCELPPNGQGFAALQMVNILKNIDLGQYERGGPEVLHYITEAKRLAFEDVARFYADPDFVDFDYAGLLTDAYGRERFALIDPDEAMIMPQPGAPELEKAGDTTYLTVADKDGMMVSLIQSNYRGMGAGLVPDGLGFMLQDRGELFHLDPDHPNVYEPGKRPFHTIIPAFVMKGDQPYMSFGLMGGSMQPQGHVQVLVNIVDFGMDLQEAGDAARLNHSGGRQPTGRDGDPVGTLLVEPGVSAETIAALRAMGHNVVVRPRSFTFGGYQAIRRNPENGVYEGGTEMRKDGTVTAY